MKSPKPSAYESVEEYLASCPTDIRERLEKVRGIIREEAPEAEEGISYGMPAYSLNGPLVYFAAQKAHLGLYALPQAIEAFADELSGYETSKGTIRFPFDRELPVELIRRIVAFRVKENRSKAKPARKGR